MNSNVINNSPFRYLNVRCPQCSKLFSVDERQIQVLRPQFECSQCHCLFYFDYLAIQPGQEVLAHLVSSADVNPATAPIESASCATKSAAEAIVDSAMVSMAVAQDDTKSAGKKMGRSPESQATDPLAKVKFSFSGESGIDFSEAKGQGSSAQNLPERAVHFCPRCEAPYSVGEKECARCGIVFAQFSPSPKDAADAQAPRFLVELWQKVLVDFANLQKHESFLEICLESGNLSFAARKYKTLGDANPADDLVQDMLKRIQALSTVGATVVKTERVEVWKLRLFGFVVALGILFIALGFGFESMRNLVGLGATLSFLAIGFRLIFRY